MTDMNQAICKVAEIQATARYMAMMYDQPFGEGDDDRYDMIAAEIAVEFNGDMNEIAESCKEMEAEIFASVW